MLIIYTLKVILNIFTEENIISYYKVINWQLYVNFYQISISKTRTSDTYILKQSKKNFDLSHLLHTICYYLYFSSIQDEF